ncbi:MAG TPA: ribosome small subunit-dependent GTPase A [Lachnospiraceae bacterium]|nr:ribosome small subunit-dependent GTPase A [Lachnospiraceae bacterium]
MKGKILKGIGGFYYVAADDNKIYECKAKGIFRNKKIKPLVGDDCEISILDAEKCIGNIDIICDRKNELIRPAAANADQAVIIFALSKPRPSINLLDRFLILMEYQHVETIICFNKEDIAGDGEAEELADIYGSAGYEVLVTSVKEKRGLDELIGRLKGKTSILAGPSGVGKSSMINALIPAAMAETGSLSEKIARGKNTTRHSELMKLDDDTFIMDTPGFSSLMLPDIEANELKLYYPEMLAHEGKCRFDGCNHINEPDCVVKTAVQEGTIREKRYENYKILYEELAGRRKW